ncbi:DC1L1 protein, partial [Polypterus senegalus]
MARLQGIDEYMKGRGLEYMYFTVHDEDRDVMKQFQEYVEPGEDITASPQRRNTSVAEDEDDSVVLPLGENALKHNLGVPILVVCTKCDAINSLEKEHDYRDEHFDFIQSYIRHFCLQCFMWKNWTMLVMWTSGFRSINVGAAWCPDQVVVAQIGTTENRKKNSSESRGWDNEKKIGILHENFQTLKIEDSFEDVIIQPPVRKFVHEKEIVSEDDQVFLIKLQEPSNRGPTGSPRTPSRSGSTNVANVTPISTGTKKIDPNMKAGTTSEGVLANFFNSLLSKKTGTPAVGGSNQSGSGTGGSLPPGSAKKSGQKLGLTDVQAELDRISNKTEAEVFSPTSPTSPDDSEVS